eukprot:scaffold938_cov334-Pavlova_lutheri.AAC.33
MEHWQSCICAAAALDPVQICLHTLLVTRWTQRLVRRATKAYNRRDPARAYRPRLVASVHA